MRRRVHAVVYWGLLWCATVVGNVPSHTLRNAFYRHVLKITLPRTSIVYWGARFFGRGGLVIGHHTIVGDHAFLDSRRGLTIGNNVNIASELRVWTAEHDVDVPGLPTTGAPVTIGDLCFIGSRVTILPGVTIGEGVVVGAGAVVTKDLPPWTVCFGVPARPVRARARSEYTLSTSERALFQ
ncbi:acyltransferase [Cellulomonas cellasea]|uniref:acyltransferase n=1 Tax=Cellulomonas cellasea TaxID=43670 RepID=UPI0009FEE885|nr:acyltransferase [Cellulomonas cellasea]